MIVKLGADDVVHDVALRVLTGEEQRLAALIVECVRLLLNRSGFAGGSNS
jgi:hypothetical protein